MTIKKPMLIKKYTSFLFTKGYASDSKKITSKSIGLVLSFPRAIKQYRFLKKSQWWTREEIEQYQLNELKKLLTHAYTHVDYYHNLFDSVKFNPEDVHSLQDIEKIPCLTKDLIRNNQDSLMAKNYPKEAFEAAKTSGSSGNPLRFYYESGKARAEELAFTLISLKRIGYHFYDKCAVLRRYSISSKGKYQICEKSLFGRWLLLSPYLLTSATYLDYIDAINAFKPRFMYAYPSHICRLASYMHEHHQILNIKLKGIICTSEKLSDEQRNLLETVFKCRIYSMYGNSEQTVNAAECEYNHEYHIFPEYGIVELIDNNGQIINEPNITGEIVTTSLRNYVFPFIRYRTGDLGCYSDLPSCKCGRHYRRLQSVDGRIQEYVYDINKNPLSITGNFGASHSKAMSHIHQYQIQQAVPGKVIFLIYPTSSFSKDDENELIEIFKQNLGNRLNIIIKYTNHMIPCGQNGKYKYVLQNVK